MKWFRDRKAQVQNKPPPQCNRSKFIMFDLSIGVLRTKLVTDKANGDGYPICRDKPDFVKKAIFNKLGSQVTSKLWKSAGKRLVEKPMKMLMGLNSLPVQPTRKRNLQESYSQGCRQHLSTNGSNEDQNLHGGCDESLTEKRLALVHQKFSEAKHLASNKRLLQSKEFKEALEVLTSNRDLLFKFLEEPNLMFSKQLKELQRTTSVSHHEKSVRKNRYTCEEIRRDIDANVRSSSFYLPKAESESQRTRIVVLKATPTIPDERQTNLASHIEEGDSGCSDSELGTPTSQKSWDDHKRSGSQGHVSSLGRESYSPESTVSMEAKKRLSERWALVSSNDISHKQPGFKKSSSTLSDMLRIPEVKSWGSFGHEQDLNMTEESILLKEAPKMKHGKSSFKERVSGLFFFRMKILMRDRPSLSTSVSSDDRASSSAVENKLKFSHENASKAFDDKFAKVSSPPAISLGAAEKRGKVSVKAIRSIEKLWKSENSTGNNQPSHVSVLEKPFQEDFVSNIQHSSQRTITDYPQALSRAPLIESVSRSLNWENAYNESVPTNSIKLFKLFSKEDEERERFEFIEKLLSSSNLTNESSTRLLAKSGSLDGQLDPILVDEFLERKGEGAKCRERRSNQRLLFDCVNVVLKNIFRRTLVDAYPWSTTQKRAETDPTVADEVCCYVKDCFSREDCISDENQNNNSKRHVDYLVKKEVAGSGLAESMWLEKDELSKEIGEKVLEDLFYDALAELTGLSL